jgi:hypothetical protein
MPFDAAVLARAGISVTTEDLERLVLDAVLRWLPPYAPPDGRDGLPLATQEALRAVGVAPEELAALRPDEPRADLEAAAEAAGLAASAFTVAEAAANLGVDPSRVRQRLAARTLFGMRVDEGWRLPRFQFTDDVRHVVAGFGTIGPLLVDLHPLDVATWFTRPNSDLVVGAGGDEEFSVSPREWLISGGDPRELLPLLDELRGYA